MEDNRPRIVSPSRNQANKASDAYKRFFMYVALIYLGGATVFTRYTMGNISTNIGFLFSALLACILYLRKTKLSVLNKKVICFIFLVIGVWSVLQCVKFRSLQIPISYIYDLVLAIVICKAYRETIYVYYEHCMSRLCLIAVILWILSICLPFLPDLLVRLTPPKILEGLTESNILVFGLHDPNEGEPAVFFRRNCGFAWEPGRFATLIIWGFFINLSRSHFHINKKTIIFLVALLTTQSTTGYLSAMFLGVMYLYNLKRKYFIFAASLFGAICTVLLSLPFMWEKIENLWISEDHNIAFEEKVNYITENGDQAYIPQRFDALLWESFNVLRDPLLGYGKDITNSYVGETFQGKMILYNGAIKILSIFGIIVGLLYYLCIYIGSVYFSKIMRLKGTVWLLIVFILINCSYYFILEPLFIAMCFLPLLIDTSNSRKNYKKNYYKRNITKESYQGLESINCQY